MHIVRDPGRAATILQPVRRRILESLREPRSAAALAREFELPRQQVNYHLRALEKDGFVELVEERRMGNCMERLVRATARSYLISPEALGQLGPDPASQRDRFSAACLVSAAARVIGDLAVLAFRSRRAGKRLSTLVLETEVKFRSPADRNAFAEELANTLLRLTAKYHASDEEPGRLFRFTVGAYPCITRTEEEDTGESVPLD
jgi:DNA-binding transcriptional ArsR family regulator